MHRSDEQPERHLAWANSLCLLFILVALAGFVPRKPVPRHQPRGTARPSVILQPFTVEPKPPAATPLQPDLSAPAPKLQAKPPAVVAVSTAVSAEQLPSPAMVQRVSYVSPETPLLPLALATGPTAGTAPGGPSALTTGVAAAVVPASPETFQPASASDGGVYPSPKYPNAAVRNRYSGTVTVLISVDRQGSVVSAKVERSSGFTVLDDAAVSVVRREWRFPEGSERLYRWSCEFRM